MSHRDPILWSSVCKKTRKKQSSHSSAIAFENGLVVLEGFIDESVYRTLFDGGLASVRRRFPNSSVRLAQSNLAFKLTVKAPSLLEARECMEICSNVQWRRIQIPTPALIGIGRKSLLSLIELDDVLTVEIDSSSSNSAIRILGTLSGIEHAIELIDLHISYFKQIEIARSFSPPGTPTE